VTGARGETTIQADGREVTVLYTNRALADAERALGRSIIAILEDARPGVLDLAHMLYAGMKAARRELPGRDRGPSVTLDDVFAVLDEAGYAAVTVAVVEAITDVLSYGPDEDGDPNA
jgi:hypothetical protein